MSMDKRIPELRTIAADIVLNVLLLAQAVDKDGRIYMELLRHLRKRVHELDKRLEELDQ